VVALALLALALGAVFTMIAVGGRSARTTNSFLQVQAQVRAALDNALDEIRWAERVCTAGPTSVSVLVPQATPFSAASPYDVTFDYDRATGVLTRKAAPDPTQSCVPPQGPAEPLAYHIVREDGADALRFRYFTRDDPVGTQSPSDPGAVARVRVTVTATREGVSRTFAGDAALRGRRD
jgi:hypothetical protein